MTPVVTRAFRALKAKFGFFCPRAKSPYNVGFIFRRDTVDDIDVLGLNGAPEFFAVPWQSMLCIDIPTVDINCS